MAADVSYSVADIDGVGGNPNTRETLRVNTSTLTAYTTAAASDVVMSNSPGVVSASGTQDEQANPATSVSAAKFNWTNTTAWEITYELHAASGIKIAGFSHDGNNEFVFTNPVQVSIPRLDNDANDSSGRSGAAHRTTFVENGAAQSVVDTDVLVTNPVGTIQQAVITLTNAQAGDALTVGTLPAGITAATDTSVAGVIKVTLTTTSGATPTGADYQTALAAIRFSNSSDAPVTVDRNVDVYFRNSTLTSNVAATTIAVAAVNDSPGGADATRTINEDAPYTFSTSDFPITDLDNDALASVVITTLPSATDGVLRFNNVPVAAGQAIPASSLGQLTFTPAANRNGTGLGAFTFQVRDAGGTANGGIDTDPSPNTFRFTVSAVDDAPINILPSARSTTEDTAIVFSTANGNAVQISDADGGVQTVTLSVTNGTLSLSGTAGLTFVTGTGTNDTTMSIRGSIADINAALQGLTYRPTADYNGPAQLTVKTANLASAATGFLNGGFDAVDYTGPGGSNGSQPGANDTYHLVPEGNVPGWDTDATDNVIEVWDTGFQGVPAYDGIQFAEINANQVAALYQNFQSTAGSDLTVEFAHRGRSGVDTMRVVATDLGADGVAGGTGVNADTVLLNERFSDGNTAWGVYSRTLTNSGTGNVVRFEFRSVSAAGGSPSVGNFVDGIVIRQSLVDVDTINIAVTSARDTVPDVLTTREDTPITFNVLTGSGGAAADNFENRSGALAHRVTSITQPAAGTGSVSFAANGTMTYTPPAHWSGTTTFTYTVTSGGVTETETVTITVDPVNDAPAGADATRTIAEDAVYTFAASDFPVTDVETHALASVVITTLPPAGEGVLRLNGVAVTAGQVIPAASLGQLTFTPAADRHGTGLGAFTFQVRDTGGTANGGVDTDPTANTFRFDVTPVVDIVPDTISVIEDTPITFNVITGTNGASADSFEGTPSVTAVTQPSNGSVTFDAAGNLTFTPAASFNGTTTFDYTVTSGGRTETTSVTITVTPINDAPVTTVPTAQVVAEDAKLVFSSGAGNPISFADIDAGPGGVETVTLAVAHGTLTLATLAGLTGVSGNGTGSVTFTGTIVQINAAVAGLTYQGAANYNGPDQLSIRVRDDGRDLGVAASNGAQSAVTRTIDITVAPVNDPPVATNDTATTTEDTPITITAATLLGNDTDLDGDPIRITGVGAAVGGTVTLDGSGNPVFTPTSNVFGPASFEYTITDDRGGTSTATVNLTIAPVNDLPVPVADAYAATENVTLTVPVGTGVLANDSDVETAQASLVVTQVNGQTLVSGAPITLPSGAVLTQNANGSFSYNTRGAFDSLRSGQTATDTFTYQVSDGQGGVAATTATITITGVNDPPVASADANTTEPRTPISVAAGSGVLTNDTDIDGPQSALVVAAVGGNPANVGQTVSGSNGGTFIVRADGSYDFDPGTAFDGLLPGTVGTTSIRYEVSDGNGGVATETLTITVSFSNLPPDVNQPVPPQSARDGDAVTIGLANVFRDPNPSDRLEITASGLPTGLSYDATTNSIVGTLDRNASQHAGPWLVTLTARDVDRTTGLASGNQVSTTFAFTVTNPPPVAINDAATVTEHGTTSGDVTSAVAGQDRDGAGDSDPLTVTEINGATFTPGRAITLPSGAKLTMRTDGTFDYDPNGAFDGLGSTETAPDSFTYTISDGQGGTSTATVLMTVTGQNEAPVLVDPDKPGQTIPSGTQIIPTKPVLDGSPIAPLDVRTVFRDADRTDVLTFSVDPAQLPAGINFNAATGTFSGTLDPNASQNGPSFDGTYPIVVTASDGKGGTVSTTVVFQASNPAPIATDDAASVAENATVTSNVRTNDRDGGADSDALTVTHVNGSPLVTSAAISLPSGARLVVNTDGTYTYDPNGRFEHLGVGKTATDTFTYQISDGQGGVDTATATITINGANDAPYVINPATPGVPPADPNRVVPPTTGTDGVPITPVSLTSYFRDPDSGDVLTLSVPAGALPPGLTFDPVTGTIAGTPDPTASAGGPNRDGTYAVTVTATDRSGATVTTVVTFTITNTPPVANPDTGTAPEHGVLDSSVLGNDRDGGRDTDPLTVVAVNGVATDVGRQITLPSGALLTLNSDGTYRYDPNGVFRSLGVGQTGTDTFTYRITDGQGGFASTTVTITITGENDAPVVINPSNPGVPPVDPDRVLAPITGSDGTPLPPVSVAGVFVDPDTGDRLTLSVDPGTLPPGLAFDPATGTFTGVPSADASRGGPNGDGVYDVVVTASDGRGGSVTTIVTIRLTNVPPIAVDDFASTSPGDPVRVPVLGNDRDGGGDTDALRVVAATADTGSVTIGSDGLLDFTPAPGFVGIATITYTISDGQGGSATARAFVLVVPNTPTPVGDVVIPPFVPPSLPANTGIVVRGAVLDAVHDVSPLSATPPTNGLRSIGASGVVLTTVNGISGLGGDLTGSAIDPRAISPVWRLQNLIEREFTRGFDTWTPEGLTGFSLRYTYATDVDTGGMAKIVLDSMVRDRTLIVNLAAKIVGDHARVVEFRVTTLDGQPLPDWLHRAGPTLLMGERPIDVEAIQVKVSAVLSDGTTIVRNVEIQTMSGEIKPSTGAQAAPAPTFGEQLRAPDRQPPAFDELLRALRR